MATTLAVAGNVDFNGDLDVDGTTNLDVVDIDGAVNMATTALVTGVLTTTAATVSNGGGQFNGAINVGVDDTGYDVKFFGATATNGYMLWDQSTDDLILGSSSRLGIGTTAPTRALQVQVSETAAGTFQTNFDIKRLWSSGVSTDRYTGMSFSDFNSINAGIYANRHSSHTK